MKTFLLMLFMGKMIFLTSNGVDINSEWYSLDIEKPLKAINGGASVIIQLPVDGNIIKSINQKDDIFKQLDKLIPPGSISLQLNYKGKSNYYINHTFAISDFSLKKENSVMIKIGGSFSNEFQFDNIMLKSSIPLNNVKIGWKNFGL